MGILWFWPLLKFAAGPAFLLWWFRRWWMAPWGTYVSHEVVLLEKETVRSKEKRYLMTVRHRRWYPPFSEYDVTWARHLNGSRYVWARERTGEVAFDWSHYKLDWMLEAAIVRQAQTEEMVK